MSEMPQSVRNIIIIIAILSVWYLFSDYRQQFIKRSDEITLGEEDLREIYSRLDYSISDYDNMRVVLDYYFIEKSEDYKPSYREAREAYIELEKFIDEKLESEEDVINMLKAQEKYQLK